MPAWSEGHPLSEAANHLIASMVRKVGGFTFQELNLTIDDIRATGEAGADLSYDFVTRPAYQHALATGDTEFLRLCLRTCLDVGVDPASLVHALQNHDELTYELLHWSQGHCDDLFPYHGAEITGGDLGDSVRHDMCRHLTGDAAPYNLVFTTNGIACTTATVIAASLGITDLDTIDDDDIVRIRSAHLLLAMYNALQPGVFALSGWDLCGMLTLPPSEVSELLSSGDTRWINRPAHDLMGANPRATKSSAGMPRGRSLYGPLPEQLDDETSFARQLQAILAVRERYGVAVSRQIDIPDVSHRGMLVMVHQLADPEQLGLTVLNFANEPIAGTVRSEHLVPGSAVTDMFHDTEVATVDDLSSFHVELRPHGGLALLVTRAPRRRPRRPDDVPDRSRPARPGRRAGDGAGGARARPVRGAVVGAAAGRRPGRDRGGASWRTSGRARTWRPRRRTRRRSTGFAARGIGPRARRCGCCGAASRSPARPATRCRTTAGAWVAASVGPYGAALADGSEYRGRYGLTVAELADVAPAAAGGAGRPRARTCWRWRRSRTPTRPRRWWRRWTGSRCRRGCRTRSPGRAPGPGSRWRRRSRWRRTRRRSWRSG